MAHHPKNYPLEHLCALAVLIFLPAAPAFAEVMDKQPSLRSIWESAALFASVGFVVGRWMPHIALITLPYGLSTPFGVWTELMNPRMGMHMRNEAGPFYEPGVYASAALVILSHLAGFALRKLSFRRHRRAHTDETQFSEPDLH